MNRQEIIPLLPELQIFLATLRRFSWLLIAISFSGYSLALWLWFSAHITLAALCASISFLLFFLVKRQLIHLTSLYLQQVPRYYAAIDYINKNVANKPAPVFIAQLSKAIQVIQKNVL
jgi:hypothetical protein